MKQLGPIMLTNIDGGDRVSIRYIEIDEKTGEIISDNNKKSFCLIDGADDEAKEHINWLRKYIRENHLED